MLTVWNKVYFSSVSLCLPLEMIRAVGAACNHYWCTLMKFHLFEVHALCLSSHAWASQTKYEPVCVHVRACVRPFSFFPSAKPAPLKISLQRGMGNELAKKSDIFEVLGSQFKLLLVFKFTCKMFPLAADMFHHCCTALVLWQDKITTSSCPWHRISLRTSA